MTRIGELSIRDVRRTLHRYPETGWREFRTTALVAAELDERGYDVHQGADALDVESRFDVPPEADIDAAVERARDAGAPTAYLEAADGVTGLVAEKAFGDSGPVVGVRADMDALDIAEATDDDHEPAREGFASEYPGRMHACGHDGHTAVGVGIAREFDDLDRFDGTLKLFFQPAEEGSRGGLAMSRSPHLDDVDYLFSLHLGFGRDTGTVVAAFDRPLANARFDATFEGTPSHAGDAPERGRNALQAAAAAIQNLYAVPRHGEGATRVNVGRVRAPNAQNVVADEAEMRVEVRGETTEIRDWMLDRAERVVESAADMYDVAVETRLCGRADSFAADDHPTDCVLRAARECADVDTAVRRERMGASEDAANLIRRVQRRGGEGTYLCVGASNPDGHHTSRFDIDERALRIGVDVLTGGICEV